MRRPLIRRYGQGDLHFVTFSCSDRKPLLGSEASRLLFLRTLDNVRRRFGFRLIGYVVMPEHVHLLVSEPSRSDLSKALQSLKQLVSRDSEANDKHFWQRRFYDFNVWSYGKVVEKLEYMHANPLKRGLVGHASEWPWSSWSHYAGSARGPIQIDSID